MAKTPKLSREAVMYIQGVIEESLRDQNEGIAEVVYEDLGKDFSDYEDEIYMFADVVEETLKKMSK